MVREVRPETEAEDGRPFEHHAALYLAYSLRVHTHATHRTVRALVERKLMPWFEGRLLRAIRAADIRLSTAR